MCIINLFLCMTIKNPKSSCVIIMNKTSEETEVVIEHNNSGEEQTDEAPLLIADEDHKLSFFEKFLALWVVICMGVGILIARYLPIVGETLNNWKYQTPTRLNNPVEFTKSINNSSLIFLKLEQNLV